MPVSFPITTSADLVSFAIFINNEPLQGALNVVSISVSSAVNESSCAVITMVAGAEPYSNDLVKSGDDIRIDAGYNSLNSPIFYGRVSTLSISIKIGGSKILIICEAEPAYSLPPDAGKQPVLKLVYGGNVMEADLTVDEKNAKLPGVVNVNGLIKFRGINLAKLGDLVQLNGFDLTIFNGNAYVSGIQHEIANGNWFTTANLGLPMLQSQHD